MVRSNWFVAVIVFIVVIAVLALLHVVHFNFGIG